MTPARIAELRAQAAQCAEWRLVGVFPADLIELLRAAARLDALSERITTIADEAGGGLQPVCPVEESLTYIEGMLSRWRDAAEPAATPKRRAKRATRHVR